MVEIYTDGATIGRNGKLGTVKEVGLGLYIPSLNIKNGIRVDGISNNEAEFKALIWGMETAIHHQLKDVRFNLDSMIVVNRANNMTKRGKKSNKRMDAFQDTVNELKKNFLNISFRWMSREQNTIADYCSKII